MEGAIAKYIGIAIDAFSSYWGYLIQEITWSYSYKPWYQNYFYWLILLSLAVWALEIVVPWRKKQKVFRKDFWLDSFYMLFNFFLFSLIAYNALSEVGVQLFTDLLALIGVNHIVAIEISSWPMGVRLLVMFILADFIHWNVHRLLHRVPWLWQFHKLHHSVKEMGFAAHLRFHWMEKIVYNSLQYIPLAMIGFGLKDLFVLHMVALLIGHLNHANLNWDYGPLKYIFNNPKMHIWHHARELPTKHGVNFGLSLSIWDYLFGTAYVPENGRDVELGFPGDEHYPTDLGRQLLYPLTKKD